MAETSSSNTDKPTAIAVLVSPEAFASALAELAAAEAGPGTEGRPGNRMIEVSDDDPVSPRTHRVLVVEAAGPGMGIGLGLGVAPDGDPLYLVEGDSSVEAFGLTAPQLHIEGKLTLREPAPHQEAGFYRRFEHRRRDGSVSRGRR